MPRLATASGPSARRLRRHGPFVRIRVTLGRFRSRGWRPAIASGRGRCGRGRAPPAEPPPSVAQMGRSARVRCPGRIASVPRPRDCFACFGEFLGLAFGTGAASADLSALFGSPWGHRRHRREAHRTTASCRLAAPSGCRAATPEPASVAQIGPWGARRCRFVEGLRTSSGIASPASVSS